MQVMIAASFMNPQHELQVDCFTINILLSSILIKCWTSVFDQ